MPSKKCFNVSLFLILSFLSIPSRTSLLRPIHKNLQTISTNSQVPLSQTRSQDMLSQSPSIQTLENPSWIKFQDRNPQRSLQNEETRSQYPLIDRILQTISLLAVLIATFIRPDDLSFIFAVSIAKSVQYIKYINTLIPADVLKEIELPFNSFYAALPLSFQMPEPWDQFYHAPLPSVFEYQNIVSSYFVNQWRLVVAFAALFIFFILIRIFETLPAFSKKLNFEKFLKRLGQITGWNLFFVILFTSYDDITLFTAIEFQTNTLDASSSIISFIVCLAIMAIAVYALIRLLIISKRIVQGYHTKSEISFSEKLVPVAKSRIHQLIQAGYKSQSILHQTYLFWLLCKITVSYIVIGSLYSYPLLETLFITVLSLCMLYYLIAEKPIRSKAALMITVFYESLTLITSILLMIISFYNRSEEVLEKIGYAVFIVKLSADICSHISLWGYAGFNVYSLLKKAKQLDQNGKITWKNICTITFEERETSLESSKQLVKRQIKEINLTKIEEENKTEIKSDPFIIVSQPSEEAGFLSIQKLESGSKEASSFNKEIFKKFFAKNSIESVPESGKDTTIGEQESQVSRMSSSESTPSIKLRIPLESPLTSQKKFPVNPKFAKRDSTLKIPTSGKVASIIMEEPSVEEEKGLSTCNIPLETHRSGDPKLTERSLKSKVSKTSGDRIPFARDASTSSLGNIFSPKRMGSSPRNWPDKISEDTIKDFPSLNSQVLSCVDLTMPKTQSSLAKRKLRRSRFGDLPVASCTNLQPSIMEVGNSLSTFRDSDR